MENSEQILISRAQGGEQAAFQQLLTQHYSMIYRVAYRFTGKTQDAEDIAQDVCMKLATKIRSFNNESNFSTWLYRVVVNACRDMQRKDISQRNIQNNYMEFEYNDRENDNDNKRKIAWLYRSISGLEQSLKETALLILTEQLSHAEAGKILGCAESTISWRMHEVRKQLKIAMGNGNG